ncbi:MAG: S8 family serine peptidase [Bacteroidales bacterium]|jgi:subtilisin family serine protease
MRKIFFCVLCFVAILSLSLKAQRGSVDSLSKKYLNWYNKDPKIDTIQGVSIERAYKELLKDRVPKKKIIVAVIDGGVDTAHIDLKGKIWKNTKEIANNGIDDDNNGYVDDLYGWNFIGNSKGENITSENVEYTRMLQKFNPIFNDVKSIADVPTSQVNDYRLFMQCKAKYDEQLIKYKTERSHIDALAIKRDDANNIISKYLNKENFDKKDVESITSTDTAVINARIYLLSLYKRNFSDATLNAIIKHNSLYLDKYLNLDFHPRTLVGDDPQNINDNKYGNNNVKGPEPEHGTLVAGVIAASRENGIGIDGIADDVSVMIIRIVPDGDERDKDVALAIHYAVDNGANIINMSFGKAFSPQKNFVDEAIKYACSHNILLVHAAGNDGENDDSIEHYPSKKFNDGTYATSMITVGASDMKADSNLAGFFSNYGQCVDLFAPGVNIISLYPENRYNKTNGTSFSCPIVSGVAALVWSYYPELSAVQLKDILLKTVTPYAKLKVYKPDTKHDVKHIVAFGSLCKTGGVVNAYNALKLAAKLVKKNKY